MTERELLVWGMKGNMDAVLFLESVMRITQVWDDLIDKDRVPMPHEINSAWRDALTGIPRNPFYRAFVNELLPLMDMFITDWHCANELEKGAEQEKRIAYIIRDSLNALIIHCAALIGGHEWATVVGIEVRKQVHDEDFEDYCRSIEHG